MAKVLDISIQGDKALQRTFDALSGAKQRQQVRAVMGKSTTSFKRMVMAKVSAGHFDKGYATGTLQKAMKAQKRYLSKISKTYRKYGFVGAIWPLPTRIAIGVDAEAKGYYPAHTEYGWKHAISGKHIPANSFMRSTMNENKGRLLKQIAKDMGKAIDKIFRKNK